MIGITRSRGLVGAAVLAACAGTALLLGGSAYPRSAGSVLLGPAAQVGEGTIRTFVEVSADGEPVTVGFMLTEAAVQGLPSRMNTTSRCFDKDGNGLATHGECLGDYEVDLEMPAEAAGLGLPFRWGMVNWNPEGHLPPAPPVWADPHFDFHFYMVDPEVVAAIRPGPCGEFIDCNDFVRATTPLSPRHHPIDYIEVGAAVPAMGNHLVDARDPEILDPSRGFTATFVYGTYDGSLIFLEPMVSLAYLTSRPDACTDVKAPQGWATAGFYPSRYCVRYDAGTRTYRVTLEGLAYRQAS